MHDGEEDWTNEDERAWRRQVVREIRRMQETGEAARVDAETTKRFDALLKRFEQGEIDKDQVKHEIMRPYLH